MKIILTGAILYLLSFDLISAENNVTEVDAASIINRYRPLILEKLEDTLCLHSSTRNLGRELLSEPLEKNIIKSHLRNLFIVLSSSSLQLSNKRVLNRNGYLSRSFTTGFIEEEKFYRLWIDLFNCNDYEFKELAYRILRDHSRPDYIKKYSSEIRKGIIEYRRAACEKDTTDNGCNQLINRKMNYNDINQMLPGDELFMLLPLSENEKKLMLKKNIPLHYRARLGDKEAENKLINKFNKVTEVFTNGKISKLSIGKTNNISSETIKLVKKLGLAGTEKCAKTLIRALNFNVPRRTWRYRSLRIDIIKALGRIHPEVPFLRMDISFIDQHSDKAYAFPYKNEEDVGKKIQDYLNKVIEWGKKTYNTTPVSLSSTPFLRVFMIMTPRYPYGGKPEHNINNITDEDLKKSEIFDANSMARFPDPLIKKYNDSILEKGQKK